MLSLSHWCSFVLVVIFHIAPEDSGFTWAEETLRKEWQKDGCETAKLLFPAYLCVTINEPKPHVAQRTPSPNCTA